MTTVHTPSPTLTCSLCTENTTYKLTQLLGEDFQWTIGEQHHHLAQTNDNNQMVWILRCEAVTIHGYQFQYKATLQRNLTHNIATVREYFE